MTQHLRKILHVLLTCLLAYTAYLQFNDPDPLFWGLLYALAALVPLAAVIDTNAKTANVLHGLAAGFCLAGLAISLPGLVEYLHYHLGSESLVEDMSPEKPYIEEGREFIGTAFAFIVSLSYWVVRKPLA